VVAVGCSGVGTYALVRLLWIRTIAEAREVCGAGVDALFVKPELVAEYLAAPASGQTQPDAPDAVFREPAKSKDLQRLIEELRYVTSSV